jgi:uridine kinase
MLAQKMPATVFSTDDYYLPFESRTPKTRATPAGHMDLKRFREEVLLPASAGMRVNYRPFNCKTGRFEKEQKITPKHFIIIEGSYSQHPDLAGSYGYKLFLTVTAQKQQRRILLRGGKESLAAFTRIWIPAEERYFKKYRIREKSDCVLDTSLNW